MSQHLTPELLVYGLETLSDPQLSPDGEGLIFTRAKADAGKKLPGSQIWIAGRDGDLARQITQAGHRNWSGRWSPDGQSIAFLSDRVAKTGLFVMPYGGEPFEITRHNGSIGEIAWSPDGATIAYVANFDPENPDERELGPEEAPRIRVTRRIDYKQDSRGYLADLRPQVWVVDVATGERRMLTNRPVDHSFPQWSPDGRKIAVKIGNHNGMQLQLAIIDVASGDMTIAGREEGVVGCWAWSPSGDHILFAGDTRQTWQLDWFLYELDGGEIWRLTDDLSCLPDAGFPTVSPPSHPKWLDDRRAMFHAVRAGKSGIYEIDVVTRDVRLLQDWASLAGAPSFDTQGRFVAQAHANLDTASSIVVFDRESGTSTVAVSANAGQPAPTKWSTFSIERNGRTIDAWVLEPANKEPGKRYPMVLDIHGGPNSFYGYQFNAIQQALAGAGFVVVFSNPRGSGSYGRDFTQAVTGDWGGEDYLDLMAVVHAAVADERHQIDPDRLGVYGYSYGGFMTSWIIGHTDRFGAAVIGAPVVDLISFYGTADIGHDFGPKQIGGTPWTNRAGYVKHSPITYLHQAKTPSLIIHGEADDRCPIGQGEQCFATLLEAGCETEFVRYPGGAHTFLRVGPPAHREDVLKRIIGWFSSHL